MSNILMTPAFVRAVKAKYGLNGNPLHMMWVHQFLDECAGEVVLDYGTFRGSTGVSEGDSCEFRADGAGGCPTGD